MAARLKFVAGLADVSPMTRVVLPVLTMVEVCAGQPDTTVPVRR
jgi:hypothetical protein|nr:hypothetical protein [Aeromicrobium sp.]